MRIAAAAALLALLGPPPQDKNPHKRFLDQKEWHGRIVCDLRASRRSGNADDGSRLKIRRHAEINLRIPYDKVFAATRGTERRVKEHIDKIPPEMRKNMEEMYQKGVWSPDMDKKEQTEEVSVDELEESWGRCPGGEGCPKGNPRCSVVDRTSRRTSGGDTREGTACAWLVIDTARGTFDLRATWINDVRLQVDETTVQSEEEEPGDEPPRPRASMDAGFGSLDLKGLPLPQRGMILKGRKRIQDGKARGWIRWTFSPKPLPPIDLRVELAGYDDWRPRGSMNEGQPGHEIGVRAWLESKSGGAGDDKAVRIDFELTDVTSEKGICINYPPEPKQPPDPDLKFLPDRNPGLRVSTDAHAFRTGGTMTEARAVISSFDWGAFGILEVTAILESGREVIGALKSDPDNPDIRIPKSADDSWIADSWKTKTGAQGADDSDDEDDPVGDGNKGDGLTLYEEYRGYMMDGTWLTAFPAKKDFFVVDEIGGRSKSGLRRFADITGLEVHHRLLPSEVGRTRVINFNYTKGPRRVGQHAIRMVLYGMQVDCEALNRAGGPKRAGTPKLFDRLIMTHAADPEWARPGDEQATPQQLETLRAERREYWESTMAHEMLHCCSVWHHGDHDTVETWQTVAAADGTLQTWRTARGDRAERTLIRVYREDGSFLAPSVEQELTVRVGEQFGQHSGDEGCVMRYDTAMAYRRAPNEYVWINGQEKTGTGLCKDTAGTALNASTGKPRYGPACPNDKRGKCLYQICVNDAVTPPERWSNHVHR